MKKPVLTAILMFACSDSSTNDDSRDMSKPDGAEDAPGTDSGSVRDALASDGGKDAAADVSPDGPTFVGCGADWLIETVVVPGPWDGWTLPPLFNSIALDSDETVRIAYYDYAGVSLYMASRSPGEPWGLETLDDNGGSGRYVSMRIDEEDVAHLGYQRMMPPSLRYLQRTPAGTLTGELIEAGADAGALAALTLGSDGTPHVTYTTMGATEVRYARRDGDWSIETIEAGSEILLGTLSLAVGPKGHVHVGYWRNGAPGQVKYARREPAGDWSIESLADAPFMWILTWPSLVSDGTGGVHYFHDATGDLIYAYRGSDTTWSETNVTMNGFKPAAMLDSAGGRHLAFFDSSSLTLQYGRMPSGGDWTLEEVDPDADNYGPASIAEQSGCVHISYFYSAEGQLRYACRCP